MPLPDTPYILSTDAWAFITGANYAAMRESLGVGPTDSPEFANLTLTSPSLGSSAPVTISQTWAGTTSTVFTAFKVNATTTTGSALTAKLLDLQHSSLNRFSVQKDGYTIIGASDAGSAVRILDLINQYGNVGFQVGGGGRLDVMNGGSTVMSLFNSGGMALFGASAYMAIGGVTLARDADNTLALRNSTAAQTFRVYNTFPGTGNNEYGEITWDTSTLYFRPAATGTATIRNTVVGSASSVTNLDATVITFRPGGASKFVINSGGLFATNNNEVDIGASGGNRPRNVYAGTLITAPTVNGHINMTTGNNGYGGGLNLVSSGWITNQDSGVIGIFNQAKTDAPFIVIGGTSASFPAIKRNGAGLQIRLADDSANATLEAGNLNIAETWNAPAIAVTSAIGTGTVATVNFATQATAIPVGTTVLITGVTPTGYNGSYVVTVSTTSSVSYANATTTSATAGGTVQRQFTTVKVSSVDTNSAPTSNLLELWSGAVTPTLKTSVTKYGTLIAGESGATKSPAVAFPAAGSYSVGIYSPAPYVIQFAMSSVNGLNDTSAYNGMQFDMTTTTLSWGASISQDIKLVRENPNQLALRNGETNQMFRVYATYSNSSNYRRCAFGSFNGTDFDIQTEGLGTGAAGGALNFGTAGVRRMSITTAGNVGIGTSTPTANLQITQPTAGIGTISVGAGNAAVTGVDTQFLNTFKVGDTFVSAGQTLTISAIASNTAMTISPVAGAAISGQVYTLAGGTRMSVLGNGNVGIGTTAPTSNLTVAGTFNFGANNGLLPGGTSYGGHLGGAPDFALRSTSATSTSLYLQNSSTGNKNAIVRLLGSASGADHGALDINTIESSPIIFTTGNSNERMRITAAGNVGIGTTAPGSALHISGALGSNTTTFDSAAALKLTNTTGNSSWLLTSGIVGVVNASFSIRQEGSSLTALAISNVGNVGIGINTPTSKLHISGTIKPEQATITTNATTAITLDISHAGTVLTTSSSSNVTITLPAAGTVGVGYNVMIIQGASGTITVQSGAGNTLNSFGNLYTSAGLHAAICIVCTAANTYNISGNLA